MGERIRQMRRRAFLSQRELAAKVGVSIVAVFYWEKGARRPSLASLKRLAEVFPAEEVKALAAEVG